MNFLSFALPILLAAEAFTLIVTHKNGQTTVIPTDEITDIRFEETVEPGQKLATPQLATTCNTYSDFVVQWYSISNASAYEWTLDGGAPTRTTATQFSVNNLKEGKHTVTVCAISDGDYENSENAVAELNAGFRLMTTINKAERTSVNVTFRSNSDQDYMVAVVPESVGRDEKGRVEYINSNAEACQRQTVKGAAETSLTISNLKEGTSYYVVAFRNDLDYSFATAFTTAMDMVPGAKGSIFPNGVSATEGFVDVDKVGDTTPLGLDDSADQSGKGGGDDEMCWACTAAGLSQWWLDEYKRVTGNDYQLLYPLPSHNIYSTDIMEALVSAYPNTAGDALMTIQWFFTGVERNSILNGLKTYNELYPYWKGGFMGMTAEEAAKYINTSQEASDGYPVGEWPYIYHCIYSLRNLDNTQAKKKFSRIMIETLREGPLGVIIPSHSVGIWGCDYEVDQDGDPIVTAVYVGENGRVNGNVKNGLNKGSVVYTSDRKIWFYCASMHDGGSLKTTEIHSFFGIKGYKEN